MQEKQQPQDTESFDSVSEGTSHWLIPSEGLGATPVSLEDAGVPAGPAERYLS